MNIKPYVGIEPTSNDYKSFVLPLNYNGIVGGCYTACSYPYEKESTNVYT